MTQFDCELNAVNATVQAQINTRQLSLLAKEFLRGADVHQCQRATGGADAAGHADLLDLLCALQLQQVAAQSLARCSVQEDMGGREHHQPIGIVPGLWQQSWRHAGH